MGWLERKWEETARRLEAAVAPHLESDEALVGVVHANQPKLFSAAMFAVGVTPSRLVLVPLDRRCAAAGPAISVRRAEVAEASVWGWGGSVADFLSATADQQIRFTAGGRKWKLHVLGGNLLEDALSGRGQREGLAALVEFLLAARRGAA
jgi:hypothetical protein